MSRLSHLPVTCYVGKCWSRSLQLNFPSFNMWLSLTQWCENLGQNEPDFCPVFMTMCESSRSWNIDIVIVQQLVLRTDLLDMTIQLFLKLLAVTVTVTPKIEWRTVWQSQKLAHSYLGVDSSTVTLGLNMSFGRIHGLCVTLDWMLSVGPVSQLTHYFFSKD